MFKKERESKEFFEVFKQPKEIKESKPSIRSPRSMQTNPTTTIFSKPGAAKKKAVVAKEEEKGPLGWIKETKSEEHIEPGTKKTGWASLKTVAIKQETLILVALGATFLSIACFFAGYKYGHNKALSPEILQEPAANQELSGEVKTIPQGQKIGAVDLSGGSSNDIKNEDPNVKWTLQIISYSNKKKNIKKAGNLAKAIKNMTGYNTFVAKRGNELVVCAGRFDSKSGTETKKALKEISNLEYEGKKQFTSSYPIKIK